MSTRKGKKKNLIKKYLLVLLVTPVMGIKCQIFFPLLLRQPLQKTYLHGIQAIFIGLQSIIYKMGPVTNMIIHFLQVEEWHLLVIYPSYNILKGHPNPSHQLVFSRGYSYYLWKHGCRTYARYSGNCLQLKKQTRQLIPINQETIRLTVRRIRLQCNVSYLSEL